MAIAVLVALAVAAGALSLGHRSQPSRSAAAPIPGTARLLNRLAVLRRPQTAADRSLRASQVRNFEVQNFNGGDGQQLVGSLTRLAQTVQTPRGTTRIYLIVETPVPGHDRIPPGVGPRLGDQVSVLFTGAGGSGAGGTQPAGNLTDPRDVGLNGVVNEGIVPDGVTRVRWVYRGLGQSAGPRDNRSDRAQQHRSIAGRPQPGPVGDGHLVRTQRQGDRVLQHCHVRGQERSGTVITAVRINGTSIATTYPEPPRP